MAYKFVGYDLDKVLMGLGLLLALLGPFLQINLFWIFVLGIVVGLFKAFGKSGKDSVKYFLSALVILVGFGILGIVPGIPQVFSDMFKGIAILTFGAVVVPAIKTFVLKK